MREGVTRGIAPRHERPEGFWIDFDGDGLPNDEDPDSDGDGLPDAVEAGDALCATVPVDTDADGAPDFLDLDSNGDGIDDVDRRDEDTDGDGILDYLDPDVDGDGIPNRVEMGADALAIDTDDDGVPDFRDVDSDGDGLTDGEEGALGTDRCGWDTA